MPLPWLDYSPGLLTCREDDDGEVADSDSTLAPDMLAT